MAAIRNPEQTQPETNDTALITLPVCRLQSKRRNRADNESRRRPDERSEPEYTRSSSVSISRREPIEIDKSAYVGAKFRIREIPPDFYERTFQRVPKSLSFLIVTCRIRRHKACCILIFANLVFSGPSPTARRELTNERLSHRPG